MKPQMVVQEGRKVHESGLFKPQNVYQSVWKVHVICYNLLVLSYPKESGSGGYAGHIKRRGWFFGG